MRRRRSFPKSALIFWYTFRNSEQDVECDVPEDGVFVQGVGAKLVQPGANEQVGYIRSRRGEERQSYASARGHEFEELGDGEDKQVDGIDEEPGEEACERIQLIIRF